MQSEAVAKASNIVINILSFAEDCINIGTLGGKSLPVTNLSKTISDTFNIKKELAYHLLTEYLKGRNDLYIKFGNNGGITRR